jgi:protein SCO1/2
MLRPRGVRNAPPTRGIRLHAQAAAVLGAGLALVLTACGSAGGSVAAAVTPTPTSGTAFDVAVPSATASLRLTDETGRTVTLASLAGKTVVLADFLTLCQEICPLTSANLAAVAAAVTKAGLSQDVVILETTVDPARDDVAHLAAYRKLFGVQPGWSFLTGSPADIAALWKSFGVATERRSITEHPAPKDWLTGTALTYDIDHQDVVIVLGPDGHERWLINGTPAVREPSVVPSTLQSFLSEDGLANETAPPDPTWTPADIEAAITYVTGHQVG